MKFAVVALATLAAAVSAADLPDCPFLDLVRVVGGDNGKKCAADSGYSSTSGKLPTDEQFQVLCFNDACESYRNELKAVASSECLVGTIFNPPVPLYATLITPIEEECKKRREAAATPAPTTGSPTPTPEPTSSKPAC